MAQEDGTDAEKNGTDAEKSSAKSGARVRLGTRAWVVISCLTLVVGVLAGHFLLGGVGTVALSGRTSLGAGELDATIATYTYGGERTAVTAREVLTEAGYSANDDGTYPVPAAKDVLAYVQNEIIFADAEARGIEVSDEELSEFATSTYGTDDYAALASQYGMEEDDVVETLRQGAIVSKLLDEVVTTELPEQPTQPEEPAEGEEDTPTADYASYVIGLLGDEWDSEANDWARSDGTYYATLSGYDISNDAATYAAASAAYSVAESAYETAATERSQQWSDYTSSVLSQATLQLGSLAE